MAAQGWWQRAHGSRQPRHPWPCRSAGSAGIRERPRRHRPVGGTHTQRRRRSVRHPHVVPGQRDGRPVANGAQKRRRLRQARSLGRGRHAHDRPGPRAGGLRFVEPHDGHVRQVGRDRARTHLRQSELRLRARLLLPADHARRFARHGVVPRLRCGHGRLHQRRRRRHRRHPFATQKRPQRVHLIR